MGPHPPAALARLLLCAALAVGATLPAAAMTAADVYARVSPSIWQVRTYDKDNLALGTGSAVVIAGETLITNCHVLKKAARFVIQRDNVALGGVLELWDVEHDICQIRARNLAAPAVALGDTARLVVGQPVYALGNPKGLELTLSNGLVSSLRRDAQQRLEAIQISAPISPGSSGGGLFDDEARLIGITSSGIVAEGAQNLNFARPVDDVRALPERHAAAQAKKTAATNVATAAPAAAAAAVAGPALSDRVPYLNDRRQTEFREALDRSRLPRACAISDNGHYACSWGNTPKDRSQSIDPGERALQRCATLAAGPCFLYLVDDTVVYRPVRRD